MNGNVLSLVFIITFLILEVKFIKGRSADDIDEKLVYTDPDNQPDGWRRVMKYHQYWNNIKVYGHGSTRDKDTGELIIENWVWGIDDHLSSPSTIISYEEAKRIARTYIQEQQGMTATGEPFQRTSKDSLVVFVLNYRSLRKPEIPILAYLLDFTVEEKVYHFTIDANSGEIVRFFDNTRTLINKLEQKQNGCVCELIDCKCSGFCLLNRSQVVFMEKNSGAHVLECNDMEINIAKGKIFLDGMEIIKFYEEQYNIPLSDILDSCNKADQFKFSMQPARTSGGSFSKDSCWVKLDVVSNKIDLSVLAHEIGHAWEHAMVALDGACQSGALKESLADFFSIAYKFNKKIGGQKGRAGKEEDIDWEIGSPPVRSFDNPQTLGTPDCIEDFTFPCPQSSMTDIHKSSTIFSKGLHDWIKEELKRGGKENFLELTNFVVSSIRGFMQQRHDFDQAASGLFHKSNDNERQKQIKEEFKKVGLITDGCQSWDKCEIYVTFSKEDKDVSVSRKTICLKTGEGKVPETQAVKECKHMGANLYPLSMELSRCLCSGTGKIFERNQAEFEMWIGGCKRKFNKNEKKIVDECIRNGFEVCNNNKSSGPLILRKDKNGKWSVRIENNTRATYSYLCRMRTCESLQ